MNSVLEHVLPVPLADSFSNAPAGGMPVGHVLNLAVY